jgi:uncharacterized protein
MGIFSPKKRRIFIAIRISFLVFVLVTAIYAFLIEPYSIEITRHRIIAPLASPIKIAHLTDIHTSGLGRREREMISILDSERPDIIFITGDTIATGGTYDMCFDVLKLLRAPLGVWLVRGNWENWKNKKISNKEREIYKLAGIRFLLNTGMQAREDIWISGFDDAASGDPDLKGALDGAPADAYKIALFHSPVYFDRVAGQFNIAFAGHIHGGQIRLPYLKPFWLPPGSGRYLEGWYEQNGSSMFVSRGIGTSLLGARLFCRPEIAFITLTSM